MESRKRFVEQVAKTILDNHSKNDAAFIFGLSGKWGEGKTKFLDDLEVELLKDTEIRIIRVNPWKFASDRISFLRNFLKAIYEKPKGFLVAIRNFINSKDQFRELYFDVSQNKVHWGWIIVIIIYFIDFILYKKLLPNVYQSVFNFISDYKWVFTVIFIPIFLAFIGKFITFQKSSKSIATIDEFDRILDEILKKEKKKLIIFVDDLDRVTPEIARDVLDNLRTFFDKKAMSFVVTGDHTVLERYLGKDLLPDENKPEQLEEGKRFLKKIFNVYWRLPLPIEKELDEFLDELTKNNKTELETIFNPDNLKIFQRYLKLYFESNFRHIIRFLEACLFTFRIIKQQIESASPDQKPYFEELIKNPLLVVRILMIQELCSPLFEAILRDPQILSDLEYAVEKKDTGKIDTLIANKTDEFSSSQVKFIKSFLYEEPRFYKASSLLVSDIRPFLYFAADASFGDSRGPSSADFMSILATGDPQQIKNALISSGQQKIKNASDAFLERLTNTPEPLAKSSLLRTLLNALLDISSSSIVHITFVESLKSIDYSFLANLNSQERMAFQLAMWRWLDLLGGDLSDYIGKLLFTDPEDFSNLGDLSEVGKFTSRILTHWLKVLYGRDAHDALNKMEGIFPKLDPKIVKFQLTDLMERLVNDILTEPDHEYRTKRLAIIERFGKEGELSLKKLIWNKITQLDQDFWNWASLRSEIYDEKDFEQQIIAALNNVTDLNSLIAVFNFAKDKIKHLNTDFWNAVVTKHSTLFVDNIGSFINDQSYASFAPDSDTAIKLFELVVDKIASTQDEGTNTEWITYLYKDKWLWKKIVGKPNRRKLGKFAKAENEALKQNYQTLGEQWTSNTIKI